MTADQFAKWMQDELDRQVQLRDYTLRPGATRHASNVAYLELSHAKDKFRDRCKLIFEALERDAHLRAVEILVQPKAPAKRADRKR